MFKEKILKLYNAKMLILAFIMQLIVTAPLMIVLIYIITEQVIISENLQLIAMNFYGYHLILFLLSLFIMPLLLYLLLRHKFKSRYVKYFCYFIFYYSLINIPLLFIEAHFMAKYSLGS